MAAAFNLTAQINLQGPTNIKSIVSNVQKQINGAKIKLNLDVGTSAAKNITSITTRLNSLSKAAINANANISTLSSSLSSLSKSFNAASSSAINNANTVAQTSRQVASAGKAVQQTRTQVEEFGKQAGLAVKRFAAFSAVTAPIYALSNAVNDAFKEFLNFNKEIVRLSQVTGQSVSELSSVSKEITRLSTSLGVASSDLLTVATTLAQAGLSAEDTKVALEALAKSALSPSFESLTDTTEGAIAAIRQFGLQTKELDGALGSINAVAAAFAVEASDIITAIQRTGGVFSSASRGVSEGSDALNEFIAIFTSVRATTRESAETIATGLRTIFTRIQRTKTIDQLRQFGIELQDTEGKFVGLFEATRRLSEGLSKIDPRTTEFATISEELGGFRQIGKVIPLIQQFAVAEQALQVAQKGVGSTSKDALIAQQSLAVQFEKTRQNFLALVREIGESTSFKAFVGVSLTLANAFINLGRSLKPLLPLLLTFASIKAGGAIKEFGTGFGGIFGGLGGKGGGPTGGGTGGPTTGGGGGPTGGNQLLTSALTSNANITKLLSQTITSLNTSVLALNQNIVNTNSLLLNRPTRGFATGGLVPGSGNRDTVRANLTPGEFVIRKSAVQAIGVQNLAAMNSGGEVQKFMAGSPGGVRVPSGKGRGKKGRKGARSRFDLPQPGDKDYLDWASRIYSEYDADPSLPRVMVNGVPTPPELAYADRLISQEVFERGGSGMMLGYDAKGREVIGKFGRSKTKKPGSLKKTPLGLLISAAGMQRGARAPAGEMQKLLGTYEKDPEYRSAVGLTNSASIQQALSAFRKSGGQSSLAGAFPGSSASKIKAAIPQYIASLGDEPQKITKAKTALQYFDSFISGGTATKAGHATAFTETVNQILKSGLVQEFAKGGKAQISDKLKQQMIKAGGYEKFISQNMFDPNNLGLNSQIANFGMVGLRSGTKSSANRTENRKLENGKRVRIHVGFLQSQNDPNFRSNIEDDINKSLQQTILKTAGSFGQDINANIDPQTKNQILEGAVLSSAVGSVFESALQMIGAPYIDKIEAIKSMDFPFGLGTSSKLFGSFPDNIPTDATRTIAGSGKGISDFLGQINRFFTAVEGRKFSAPGGLEALPTPQKLSARQMAESLFGSVKANPSTQSAINNILVGDRIPGVTTTKQTTKRIDSLADNLARNPETMKKLEAAGYGVTRRATGGGISGEDTVPALLTPGEFVFNKDSAQRIGYGTLNKLNKVKGFNKGGVVGPQKFAAGGPVGDNTNLAIGAIALSSVLLPEIEKLAQSFSSLRGETSSYTAALGGAIKESSSLALSTGIALKTIGADKRTTAFGVGGAAIAGAISGALTEGTGKALEKALLKNTDLFGKFDKTLQDLSQAPTEELRLEAAKRLEKTFNSLDASVIKAKTSIDSLEFAQKAGESLNNFSVSLITGITSFRALKDATSAVVIAAQQAVARASAAQPFANMSGAMGAAAGAATSVGFGTKLLATFGKFIPYVGLAITGFSVLNEGIKLFSGSLNKTSEQFDRLYKNLDETTKNSQAFSIANKNFVDKILPEFTKLRNQGFSGESLNRRLGTIGNSQDINELNFTFRTLLRSRLVSEGIPFSDMETMRQLTERMSSDQNKFGQIFSDTSAEFTQRQFVRSQTELGGMSTQEAEARFKSLGGADSEAVKRIVEEYVGAKNREIAALRELTLVNNKFKNSLVNLDNILITLSSSIETSISKTLDQFDDLDRRLSIIGGEARPQGGEILRRQIATLNNIRGASETDIKAATSSVASLLNIQQTSPEQQKLFNELRSQVEASRVLQQELPVILREVQSQPGGRSGEQLSDILRTKLGSTIQSITKDAKTTDIIFKSLTDTINANINSSKESINSAEELAQNDRAVAELLKTSEKAIKAYNDILEAGAKFQDKLAEQTKRRVDLENQLIQVSTQRLQLEAQEANELNRLLGITTSLADLNKTFDISIKQLTGGIGAIPKGGTTDVGLISKQLSITRANVEARDKELQASAGNFELQKKIRPLYDTEVSRLSRLNKALTEIATSGEKTKNALDKIAQAQDQFKSRRQVLIDFLRGSRNPETALQNRLIVNSIQAAFGGGFRDTQQAELFLDQGVRILEAMKVPEATINRLVNVATGRMLPSGLSPEDKKIIESFLQSGGMTIGDQIAQSLPQFFGPFLAKIFPDSAFAQLKSAQEERRIAAEKVGDSIADQIKLSVDGTASIFDNFNLQLNGIFPATIKNLQRIEEQTRAKKPETQFNIPLSKKATSDFQNFLIGPAPKVSRTGLFGFGGLAQYEFGPEIFSNEQKAVLRSRFGESQNLEDQIKALEKTRNELMIQQEKDRKDATRPIRTREDASTVLAARARGGLPGSAIDNARTEAIARLGAIIADAKQEAYQILGEQISRDIQTTINNIEESPINIPLPSNRYQNRTPSTSPFGQPPDIRRIQGRAPLNDGASIQRFENSANTLSKSLNEAPLQNLSDGLGSFNTTATQLVSALKDFTSKFQDGMKGEISYTGDISLNFNEALDVNIPNAANNRNNLISDIDRRLTPTIRTAVSNGLKQIELG